jgi:DNA adenine methylase
LGGDTQSCVADKAQLAGIDGGKFNLLKHFLPFPIHTTFIEVFGGSSVVLFNKIPSVIEVINDINSRLINMWMVIKKNRREMIDFCRNEYGVDSRQLFDFCKNNIADNPYEDAARFFYINHHSFSQMNESYHGLSFTGKEHWHHPYLNKLKNFDDYYERIKYVQFECQDFRKIMKRADKKGVLFFLDPPYFKGGELYEYMAGNESKWTQKDFEDLREILNNMKNAMFVLTVDSKDYFNNENWFYQEVERINAASLCVGGEKSTDIEYVIRNFDPSKTPTMRQFSSKEKIKDDMIL